MDLAERHKGTTEGKAWALGSPLVLRLYPMIPSRAFRNMLRRLVLRAEGGAMYSLTVREIYRRFHGVEVGLYTIGPCEAGPDNFGPGTRIGRFSSIYYTVRTITRDYPCLTDAEQSAALESALGGCSNHNHKTRLEIGHDVFIGHNAIVLPTAERIGDGAFVGAGCVVHSPVPPYAVVMGNPARVVRYRFSPRKIEELIDSAWWLKSLEELRDVMGEFQKPLEGDVVV